MMGLHSDMVVTDHGNNKELRLKNNVDVGASQEGRALRDARYMICMQASSVDQKKPTRKPVS